MTAGPSPGPASAYPTLSTPASTCFSTPNEPSVPAVIAGYRPEPTVAWAAFTMWSVTACGWEIMITCEPSTSTMSAPARRAIDRPSSPPAALSPVATTAQDGSFLQAGGPEASLNAAAATGRWVAAISAVVSGGRSAAKDSGGQGGVLQNSTAVSPSRPVG